MSSWKRLLDQPRKLEPFEESSIIKMIGGLPDNHILMAQLQHAEVISVCDCGCKTVDLRVPRHLDKYVCSERIPVEMTVENGDSSPILFLLHVMDGYLDELEILKLDASPIFEEIDLGKGVVEVKI
jgi:hypothetical protein